jgi:hypothetical protein
MTHLLSGSARAPMIHLHAQKGGEVADPPAASCSGNWLPNQAAVDAQVVNRQLRPPLDSRWWAPLQLLVSHVDKKVTPPAVVGLQPDSSSSSNIL